MKRNIDSQESLSPVRRVRARLSQTHSSFSDGYATDTEDLSSSSDSIFNAEIFDHRAPSREVAPPATNSQQEILVRTDTEDTELADTELESNLEGITTDTDSGNDSDIDLRWLSKPPFPRTRRYTSGSFDGL